MVKPKNIDVINSRFTRENGYTEITSSKKIDHQKAINILNSFTPQGASPKLSLRIGTWGEKIGAGYYFMQNDSDALISTFLFNHDLLDTQPLQIPLTSNVIEDIASGASNKILQLDNLVPVNIVDRFDFKKTSMILYSLLAGDNMIIIHPNHQNRVEFVKSLINLVPSIFFKYNRITTGCSELDGNENIIGVDKLPAKYRSHKALYLSIDTIFIDLVDNKIMGEGLKSNDFTRHLARLYTDDPTKGRRSVINYFRDITGGNSTESTKYGKNSMQLTHIIREKLGFETGKQDDWLATF